MKKFMSVLLVLAMALALVACGSSNTPAATTAAATEASADGETAATEAAEASAEAENALIDADGNPFHVGIVTGSVSQSEDDRRGAEAFQQLYGEENVTLVTYPDNFTEELETTIQCMSSKITSAISVQLMPLYKSPHITKGLSSAAVLTGRGGNVTISTSSLGEKNR